MSEELEAYIKLIDFQLEHPFTTEIHIANGKRKSSEEFVFAITPSRYRKLEQIRGEYNFKFRDREYECNILHLTRNQVRLQIEGLDVGQKHIKSGAINVDTSNILEREKKGLQQLKEENFVGKRHLLLGNNEISGGAWNDCIFEEELNEDQKCAVEYAVGVQDVYLIWGPPGTGKTTIVPEIVRNYIRLYNDNLKILVCSYTNRAVDNVVMKLFDGCKNIIVRFGSSTLMNRYKYALFDEQLEKKQKKMEKEFEWFKEKKSQLSWEKAKLEEKRKSKDKEAENVEKDKEAIKTEIDALNVEISRIKEQIIGKELSRVKTNLEEEKAKINGQLQEYRDNLIKLPAKKREINEEIEELKIHVSKLEDLKSDIKGKLEGWNEKEGDTANIIRIIEYYLDFAEGPRQEIESLSAELPHIKNLIAEKERSLLNARFTSEINQIDEELRSYRENLDELQQEKEKINRAIKSIENEVHRLKRAIPGIREQLDQLRNNEPGIVDIIHIVNFYLECARRNIIVAYKGKNAFKRRNPLYKRYEQKINELQLARRNRIELEGILREKLEEQSETKEKIAELQNELNERERETREKEEDLTRKNEDLIAVEENHKSLSENIKRSEKKREELKRNRDSLARGELEYDKDALRRENPELRVLYGDLKSKNDRNRSLLSDFIRGRSELLYEQYRPEITELQLEEKQRIELEIILQENLEKQNDEQGEITKVQNELNEREREIGEKKKELLHKKEELKSVERSHASLSENVGSGERKREELKRDIDSLAHGRLEYDRDALRRENPELRELYNELSNKESEMNQKESDLKEKEQKRIDLSGLIERLMNSVREKIKEIKVAEQEMQEEIMRKTKEAKLAVLNEKQIIATTNLRTYDKLFEHIKFDLVIMDEAGAIDLPGAVLPFLKGNKFILLGDPEQLPPILVDRHPKIRSLVEQNPGLRLSIFERFYKANYGDNQAVTLTSQYRMKREIAAFISASFYEGRLNSPTEVEIDEKLQECQDDIVSNRYSMVCFPRRFWTDYEGGSAVSPVEIGFIKKIIEKFGHQYGKRIYEEIAIISPYRAQIGKIEDEIPDIECGTVHTFQGQEKRIIIFSTANYQRGQSSGFGKPLEGPASSNLLNVAVSRAKEKFIIIGSKELFENVPIYKKLYGHIQEGGYENRQNCCRMCGEAVPEGRSAGYCSEECYRLFQLKVHEGRNPRKYKADDKDCVRSTHEMLIDNWLYRNKDPYLFSWDNVPGNDSDILLKFLRDDLDIGWMQKAEISKSDDDKTIHIIKDESSAEIVIDEKKEKATLNICDGRTCSLKVKKDGGKLNIYKNRIGEHEVEKQVPVNKLMYCDWFLPRWDIYVEYWGLMHEEWYREARKVKEKLYKRARLKLRSIEREDMTNLDENLRRIFSDVLDQ
jgi:superfamily I DNA and/or RNA helicase